MLTQNSDKDMCRLWIGYDKWGTSLTDSGIINYNKNKVKDYFIDNKKPCKDRAFYRREAIQSKIDLINNQPSEQPI